MPIASSGYPPFADADALATVSLLRHQVPLNTDFDGIVALLLVGQSTQDVQPQEQQGQQTAAALTREVASEAADCCCQLLAANPSCHGAALTLLALHEQQPLPLAQVAGGCSSYLDAQPPSWLPPLVELRGAVHCSWLA